MSRKNERPYNLILAFVVLAGVGGVLGVSSLNVKLSAIGITLIIVAVLESALILGGFALLSRRRRPVIVNST
jgi:predicted lysophospholipase L1 biosynthesis ABC-type transport system permease subunit